MMKKDAVLRNANWLIEDVLRLEKFIATNDGDIKHTAKAYFLSLKENVNTLERVIDNTEKK